MPWEKGHPIPGDLKGRETFARLVLLARTEVLSDFVGHLKSSQDGLPNRGPQTLDQRSRRIALSISSPRASACGLGPGIRSPGPLGRPWEW